MPIPLAGRVDADPGKIYFSGSSPWVFGPPMNNKKIQWGGRSRPPGGSHRLKSLCHRKNFLDQKY